MKLRKTIVGRDDVRVGGALGELQFLLSPALTIMPFAFRCLHPFLPMFFKVMQLRACPLGEADKGLALKSHS